ncbi:hypothetical protein M569_07099 [Genlisea aurea]|uniref:DYW domain-containing protein n=1 Tax=Genlisea aurea TaxID=192259 RepID=S8CLQ6_9LAMI|nr:hypothetical protein M569_07099 [Genlisea aurea]
MASSFSSSVMVWNSLKLWASPLPSGEKKRRHALEDVDKAFDFSNLGVRGGFSPEECNKKQLGGAFSYFPLLRESMDDNSVSGVESLHAHIVKNGVSHDVFVATFLLHAYCKCGNMDHAQNLFDEMTNRTVFTWGALISGYVQNSNPESSVVVFRKMLEAGIYPTNYTLSVVLKACSSLPGFEMGKQIHGYIAKYRIDHDTSTGNSLCSFYSKFHELDMAIRVFNGIAERDVISWTSAISACKDNGNPVMGLRLFVQMLDEGIQPSSFTLTCVIALCRTLLAPDLASQVQSLSIKLGYGSDSALENSFMYLCLTNGCITQAKKLFYRMDSVNLVAWNAMIAGHEKITSKFRDAFSAYSCGVEALGMLREMYRSGIGPDSYTFSSVLTICSSLLALQQGEQVHAQAVKSGFSSDPIFGTSLVNMYSKCGSIERASKAFSETPERTVITWTSMIAAFGQHGFSAMALDLFEEMRFVGVKPNRVTFLSVFSACTEADQGLGYYKMMRDEYGISPGTDHVASLVHAFVRCGRIEEAFEFVQESKTEPSESIWSVLIAGCRIHGKKELMLYAADQLLRLKSAEDVNADEGIIQDWSWIAIRDRVYSFEEKKKTTIHSEKMAVRYGLRNANRKGGIICVVKSRGRVCRDCHDFMKSVSLSLKSRTVVVRDVQRSHIFFSGRCSCGDLDG